MIFQAHRSLLFSILFFLVGVESDIWALIDDKALVAPTHKDIELISKVEIFHSVHILNVDRSDTNYSELRWKI